MPPQNRVRCHNRRHLTQRSPPEAVSPRREASPLIVREAQTSAAQLRPQDAILFHEIRDHVLLLPTEPPGNGGKEELKRGEGTITLARV